MKRDELAMFFWAVVGTIILLVVVLVATGYLRP